MAWGYLLYAGWHMGERMLMKRGMLVVNDTPVTEAPVTEAPATDFPFDNMSTEATTAN